MLVDLYVALALIVFVLLPAYFAGRIAQRRGRPRALYTGAGIMLGPIVMFAALLLPRRR